jgi:pyruvate dehydrogenase E2 component (dihydrolipoamide acetyltransferase)
MSDIKEVLVPDLGEDSVEVIEICVSVGDSLDAEDSIVTVESDKASMDIPAPFAGDIAEICVAVGDKISEGSLLAKMKTASAAEAAPAVEETVSSAPAAAPAPAAVETAPAPAAAASTTIEVTVPDIGGDENVDVIEILVAVGDTVEVEDGLVTLETDKASMDVPSPQAGTITAMHLNVGDKVSEGSLVVTLATASAEAPTAEAPVTDTPAPAAAPASAAIIEVTVPDIGGDENVDVIDVLVAAGDTVEAEDGLITLETDKASMDVPSPQAGTIKSVHINVGDKVSQGSLVVHLEVAGSAPVEATPVSASAPAAAAPAPVAPAQAPKAPPVPHHPSAATIKPTGKVHASPSVRRLAREFGVDLTQVNGSGNKGRIIKEDVQSYVKYELSRPKLTAATATAAGEGGLQVLAAPKVDFSKFGEIEEKPLTRIQKISGPNLHRNWVTIPHVTQFEEADITDMESFRKEQNVVCEKRKLGFKITPLVFMMKAVADALQAYPTFNSSLSADGESLILKKYFHIGIAVDTPNGLVVPVVRDVDQKGVHELSKELMDISVKARDGKLKAADMQGSCFTISSLGGIGGTAFTPIVNAPDVAILGVSKSEIKPKWNGKDFEPRLMLPLSLSYDHRVIDGALAARFAVHIKNVLGDLRQIIL